MESNSFWVVKFHSKVNVKMTSFMLKKSSISLSQNNFLSQKKSCLSFNSLFSEIEKLKC